jgi:AcrR family transcriptional regulator
VTRIGVNSASYHRGDVRQDAVVVATRLIRADGSAAITLREIAAQLGVSHTALYRHFDGRDGVLDAVAGDHVDTVASAAESDASIGETLTTYVRWALNSEHLYRCAFEMSRSTTSPLTHAAFDRLRAVVAKTFAAELAPADPTEVRDEVFRRWGAVHGLVDLYWQGLLRARSVGVAARLITGLAVRDRSAGPITEPRR